MAADGGLKRRPKRITVQSHITGRYLLLDCDVCETGVGVASHQEGARQCAIEHLLAHGFRREEITL